MLKLDNRTEKIEEPSLDLRIKSFKSIIEGKTVIGIQEVPFISREIITTICKTSKI